MMGGTVIIACRSEDKAMEVRAGASSRETCPVFPTRSDINGAVQPQKMVKSLEISDLGSGGIVLSIRIAKT